MFENQVMALCRALRERLFVGVLLLNGNGIGAIPKHRSTVC